LKSEKYFDFLKMDKKNVQNRYVKTLLTDEIFCLDDWNLWCQIKPKIKKLPAQFFNIYAEKYLSIFSLALVS
jgi:hypothetical protein